MNYLYSLYDALVSISVPADKARAVVDAMERDMGTTLATKRDVSLLATREDLLATKQDLKFLATKDELLATRQDLKLLATKEELLLVKQDVAVLRQQMENRFALQDQKINTLELRLTVKLGSMLVVGFGLTIAALRLWT
ncbi:MAG: hypothetical protein ACREVI_14900 [Steroidobacteraceae bacterium]